MTLLDAKQYDPGSDRRKRIAIMVTLLVLVVAGWVSYHYRNYPARHAVAEFFAALQQQDFGRAYGIWQHDPQWKQHPSKYPNYGFNDFYRDWGPSGEWGVIKTYSVDCSLAPGNGVIVGATVNGRAEHPSLWVGKNDRTISFSPNEIQCGNWWSWLTE